MFKSTFLGIFSGSGDSGFVVPHAIPIQLPSVSVFGMTMPLTSLDYNPSISIFKFFFTNPYKFHPLFSTGSLLMHLPSVGL